MGKKNTGDRLAYGLTIMIFGILFLLDKIGILDKIPYASNLVNIGTLCLIAGIVFLCTKVEKKIGIILTIVGVIINSDFFFGWMRSYSNLIVPVILIIAGLIMILSTKK